MPAPQASTAPLQIALSPSCLVKLPVDCPLRPLIDRELSLAHGNVKVASKRLARTLGPAHAAGRVEGNTFAAEGVGVTVQLTGLAANVPITLAASLIDRAGLPVTPESTYSNIPEWRGYDPTSVTVSLSFWSPLPPGTGKYRFRLWVEPGNGGTPLAAGNTPLF